MQAVHIVGLDDVLLLIPGAIKIGRYRMARCHDSPTNCEIHSLLPLGSLGKVKLAECPGAKTFGVQSTVSS